MKNNKFFIIILFGVFFFFQKNGVVFATPGGSSGSDFQHVDINSTQNFKNPGQKTTNSNNGNYSSHGNGGGHGGSGGNSGGPVKLSFPGDASDKLGSWRAIATWDSSGTCYMKDGTGGGQLGNVEKITITDHYTTEVFDWNKKISTRYNWNIYYRQNEDLGWGQQSSQTTPSNSMTYNVPQEGYYHATSQEIFTWNKGQMAREVHYTTKTDQDGNDIEKDKVVSNLRTVYNQNYDTNGAFKEWYFYAKAGPYPINPDRVTWTYEEPYTPRDVLVN